MNEKQNLQYSVILKHWPPRGWRCPFCSGIHKFPESMWFPIGYRRSIDLFCEKTEYWGREKDLMLQLWADEGQTNVWQLFYSALASENDPAKDINIHFGKKYWAEWKVPNFLSNEIWFVGKLGNSLPIKGAKYLPSHVIIFGFVFNDETMGEICATNPPIITASEVDRMYMSRNRFEARHRNGTATYYDNSRRAHTMVFMPRSYFRSTPFMDNFMSIKRELGAIPDEVDWERDASVHYANNEPA